ncbi:hypothetical protein AMAG_20585 [Allomyces macrogynus ATCC 38327]|uniref:Uncharacterized protein n=1 Tax=Allomyces macrogynus (strain ATCC 38327) TaxID=578462 RepID=A0A0L0TDU5_ALLM3|nr:hypothetical protein AMAG_20585 [Allomyces macrogynus ATCC 38327]|eukprot:KNE72850.1 hypothetical protein AMAG_20585 [Allomyces macrogynus ATCC 38327]
MWPSTPARHPSAAPVAAAPVAAAPIDHHHPALPVIATVSTTEINDAKHAYKDMLRAASDMHVAMRALAQKARDFAAALHDFAHAVPGSVVPSPTVGRGDWTDDDVDDDGAGLGVRNRSASNATQCAAAGIAAACDAAEAGMPALTAIPAAYAGLPRPPHSPAPARPITSGRAGRAGTPGAPPVVTDTDPDSYDTLVAASAAHDEVGELRQRKWSVSTGVSVAISEYIVAGTHVGNAVPPMPPLPPTTVAAQR